MRRIACGGINVGVAHRLYSCNGFDFLLNPTPEHEQLRKSVQKFATEKVAPLSREMDMEMKFNKPLFKEFAKDLGILGLTVPESIGGCGMDATAAVIVHHELTRVDSGFCLAFMAHSMLFVNNLYWAANEEQRQRFIPPALTGDMLCGMGMSEPGVGTDVLGMTTTAKRDGDKGYRLNGSKIWITNGTVGDMFLVYAKVDGKITSFVVERSMEGFSSGPPIHKCGNRSSEFCQLFFDNVFVPVENRIGGEGKGIVNMMRNLELERVCAAGCSVGNAEACVEMMVKFAKQRKAFGKPIVDFGQIQRYIAESFAATEAAKCLTYAVAKNVAPGVQNRLGTDAAKLFSAPISKQVADNAIQVMGAMGYTMDMPVERMWRDAKLSEIGAGTIEAHHKNITNELSALEKD